MFDLFVSVVQGGFNILWIGFMNIIAGILPTINNPNINFITALDTILDFGMQLSFIIPWPTIFTAVLTMTLLEIALVILKFALWVAKIIADKIPTGS
jgi:hypothetical protein